MTLLKKRLPFKIPEAALNWKIKTSQDILEDIKALTEKRKPQWQGK